MKREVRKGTDWMWGVFVCACSCVGAEGVAGE